LRQEYLARLQAQKNGSGAQAFDFLSEKKTSTIGEIDNGFTQAQMQILEDTEEVLPSLIRSSFSFFDELCSS
jgi:hypothetical protein